MSQIGDSSPDSSLAGKTLPPPPPTGNLEVTIRTLASDLELIGKSGGVLRGGSGQVSVVGVGGKITAAPAAFDASGSGMPAVAAGPKRDNTQVIIWTIVAVVGTIILFLVGYYFIPLIVNTGSKNGDGANVSAGTKATSTGTTGTGTGTTKPPVTPISLGHTTFFRTSTPAISFNTYVNNLPPDRASFVKTLTDSVNAQATSGNGTFYEVIPKGLSEKLYSWSDLTSLLGAGSIASDFLTANFERDYTFFVSKSGSGQAQPTNLATGYIFKLQKGKNPLLLQRDALAIENDSLGLSALFLTDPGIPNENFTDTQVSGQPTRTLTFTTGTGSAAKIQTFRYGWFFGQYLIMSTSDDGLKAAIERL
jgi:hypothetical protein